jgi:hypothetical protein
LKCRNRRFARLGAALLVVNEIRGLATVAAFASAWLRPSHDTVNLGARVAELLEQILAWPAAWGFLGAFIYAAPRWVACAWASRGAAWRCSIEAVVCLAVGAIAAAAFARWALAFLHQSAGDLNAVAAMIGLLANSLAPRLVDGFSALAANAITTRAAKLLKSESEKP